VSPGAPARIGRVLSPLRNVRHTGPGRYMACCPAHEDRSPSLSIRETDDGLVLLYCFAGCSREEIVGALGLKIADLMPRRALRHRVGPNRSAVDARQVLEGVAHEIAVVMLIAEDTGNGMPLGDANRMRLTAASRRLWAALKASPYSYELPEMRAIRRGGA
jgi:hypothetical protein